MFILTDHLPTCPEALDSDLLRLGAGAPAAIDALPDGAEHWAQAGEHGRWWRKPAAGISASLLFHCVLAAAAVYIPSRWAPQALHVQSGRTSVTLLASVASPTAKAATEPLVEFEPIERFDEPPTRQPPPPEAEVTLARRPTELPLERLAEQLKQVTPADVAAEPPPLTSPSQLPVEAEPELSQPTPAKATVEVDLPMEAMTASAASAASVASQGAANTPPHLLYNPAPAYPPAALSAGQQGRVLLRIELNDDGQVRAASVIEPSGHRLLDEAALAAVRNWRFEPTGDRPTARQVAVPVRFTIAR